METRICYQERVNAGTPQACSVEKFNELLDSPLVKKICEQIEALDKTAPDYEEKKGALKRRLPVLIPHACGFKNGKRKKVTIFKYNPKKGYRKRQGHRQPYTKVQIGAIKA